MKKERPLRVGDLIDKYFELGPATRPAKRELSWKNDASNLDRHVRPLIGAVHADEVSRLDASRVLQAIRSGETSTIEKTGKRGLARVKGGAAVARRTRGLASALWSWAIEHGYLHGSNPFANLRLGMAPERDRFLSAAEAHRFLLAVADLQLTGHISSGFADACGCCFIPAPVRPRSSGCAGVK